MGKRYKQQDQLALSALSRPWAVLVWSEVSSSRRPEGSKNREGWSNSCPLEHGQGYIEQLT